MSRWAESTRKQKNKAKKQKRRPPKPNNCSKKYQQWDDESMSGAIKSIMEGKMGINRVASPQGLYLSASEEDELFQHLLTCAKIGYPKTKCQAIGIV